MLFDRYMAPTTPYADEDGATCSQQPPTLTASSAITPSPDASDRQKHLLLLQIGLPRACLRNKCSPRSLFSPQNGPEVPRHPPKWPPDALADPKSAQIDAFYLFKRSGCRALRPSFVCELAETQLRRHCSGHKMHRAHIKTAQIHEGTSPC